MCFVERKGSTFLPEIRKQASYDQLGVCSLCLRKAGFSMLLLSLQYWFGSPGSPGLIPHGTPLAPLAPTPPCG